MPLLLLSPQAITKDDDMSITVEEAFWLLADASGARSPNPDRETRGNCPAHGDHDPGLSFRIGENGNLLMHCFAQTCTMQRIADSLGISMSSFFPAGGHRTGKYSYSIEWSEQPVLELLKLVPFGYDFDTQVELVMQTLHSDLTYAERGLSELFKTELTVLCSIWLDPSFDYKTHGDWNEVAATLVRTLYNLNRDTRVDPEVGTPSIPRG